MESARSTTLPLRFTETQTRPPRPAHDVRRPRRAFVYQILTGQLATLTLAEAGELHDARERHRGAPSSWSARRRTKRHCSAAAIEQQCRRGSAICKDAKSRLRHDPSAEDHGGGSGAHLNGAWPPASQERALMAAKASAGLARASEGELHQCAVARQPEWGSVASSRGEAHGSRWRALCHTGLGGCGISVLFCKAGKKFGDVLLMRHPTSNS